MANGLLNTSGKFGQLTQFGKWINSATKSGITARIFDAKPIWAQLKITERCNLNCGYCTEHNNNGCHVPRDTIYSWIDHYHALGVKHLEFIGGEPLMHPDIFDLLAYAKSKKIRTGLTTNGFLLNRERATKLIDLDIKRLQLSIDCVEPNNVTKKAVTLLMPQLDLIKEMDIWVHVNSVIVKETISSAYELANTLFEIDIPVAFSPAHHRGNLIVDSSNDSIVRFLRWLSDKKKSGAPVNMPQFLINYFIDILTGVPVEWVCEGGCKAFYVDTKGHFLVCSHKDSNLKFLDVDKKILENNHHSSKGCEKNCGVSCMLLNSFPFSRLDYVLKSEFFSSANTCETVHKIQECTV